MAEDVTNSLGLDGRSRYLRRSIVRALHSAGRGHFGPSMSLVEVLRVLYDDFLRFDAKKPDWEDRDRCILSKGHGCLALYAVLVDKGFFSENELDEFCKDGAMLGGHPETDKIPGVEASTGALGHGLSIAMGMAVAARIKGKDYRTVVITGDGELNEGSIWEAAMSCSKHSLSNLTVFVDCNRLQIYGTTQQVLDLEPLRAKWESFNFAVEEVDGHDVASLRKLVCRLPLDSKKPTAVICHTIKGKGFSFAENNPLWHYKFEITEQEVENMLDCLRDGG